MEAISLRLETIATSNKKLLGRIIKSLEDSLLNWQVRPFRNGRIGRFVFICVSETWPTSGGYRRPYTGCSADTIGES